jgi:hypothetical protein
LRHCSAVLIVEKLLLTNWLPSGVVLVFVMGLKLATAFKSARTFYQPLTLFFILPTQTLLKINCD